MPSAFGRSLRALAADSSGPSAVGLLVAATLLGGWSAWFVLVRVNLYEVSGHARLEVDQSVHSIETPVAGRIVRTRLELDAQVTAGEVLVELDARQQELELGEARARLDGTSSQLKAIVGEIAAEEQALEQRHQAGLAEVAKTRALHKEADLGAKLAHEEAERFSELMAGGSVADEELRRARSVANQRKAAAEAAGSEMRRLEWEQRTRESDQRAGLERLRRDEAALATQAATESASIDRLEYEIDRRRIRAPLAGRIGEIANLHVGQYVREGDGLGAILPAGKVKIAAEFLPAALGRIRAGQAARMRLDGFPWIQYGSIGARVVSVASEIRDGTVRVELEVLAAPASPIPLQHGLPGTLEIEVGRASPATLVLRAAGRLLGGTNR